MANSWWAKIREGLVKDTSGKHYRKMGESIWLYLYLHMGAELESGNLIRKYQTISSDTGIPESTIRRMMAKLKKHKYVKTTRLSHGLSIQITNWKPEERTRSPKNNQSKNKGVSTFDSSDSSHLTGVTTNERSLSDSNNCEKVPKVSTCESSNKIPFNKTQIIYKIFQFWNDQKIIVHRNLSKFESSINTCLKDYAADEICQAIKNYSDILNHPDCYFSYRWSLNEFLNRKSGLDKFLDRETAYKNYTKTGFSIGGFPAHMETKEEKNVYQGKLLKGYQQSFHSKFDEEIKGRLK